MSTLMCKKSHQLQNETLKITFYAIELLGFFEILSYFKHEFSKVVIKS